MKYLHVSPPSFRMMNTYTKMIRDNFPLEDHRFLYLDAFSAPDRELLKHGNCVEAAAPFFKQLKIVYREMEQADIILWHGITFGAKRALIPCIFRKFARKSVWVVYGLDLYNWKKEGHGLKTFLTNLINRQCRKIMPYVGLIHEADETEYRRQFGDKAKLFYVPYPISTESFDQMEVYRGAERRNNGKLYVQVSHNAYTFNNHLSTLNALQHFSDEDIRLIIPLSYGNNWYNSEESYISKVRGTATRLFGNKAACLKRLMPQQEYTKTICNMDIAIFGAKRQNGLGNILKSLYLGNKVYLSVDNPLYQFFLDRDIAVYPAEEISEIDFDTFREPTENSNAVRWIRSNYHPCANIYYWKALFASCAGEDMPCPGTASFENIVGLAVKNTFEELDKAHKNIRKVNYLSLAKYELHPPKTVLSLAKNVTIVGVSSLAYRVFWDIREVNKSGTKWIVDGFADNNRESIGERALGCDINFSVQQLLEEETNCIITSKNIEQRKTNYELIKQSDNPVLSYIDSTSTVFGGVSVGEGSLLLDHASIRRSSTVGVCTCISGSTIGIGTEIGSFCNIENNCTIGDDVVIGDFVVIGSGSVIGSDVVIEAGTVIPPDSHITM